MIELMATTTDAAVVPDHGGTARLREADSSEVGNHHLVARANQATWFTPSKDVCTGKTNPGTAMIAALSTDLYGKTSIESKYCGRCARAKGSKGTVMVKITDACSTCEKYSFDLTKSAFQCIASLNAGMSPSNGHAFHATHFLMLLSNYDLTK
jgi:Fe-S cluster biogenesis protein NfuA